MSNWLKTRVQSRLDELNLGPVEAATAAQIERTFIRDIIQDRKQTVRVDGAVKLSRALQLPKEAFLYQEWRPGDAVQDGHYPDYDPDQNAPARDLVFIPEYDIQLAAGSGRTPDRQRGKDDWPFSRRFLSAVTLAPPEQLSIVEVVGDSMAPKLQPHDRILVNHADINPTPPGIFALWDGYGLVVKNVQRVHRSDPEKLLLISENPVYPPYEVLLDEVTLIGRVVWFSRRM